MKNTRLNAANIYLKYDTWYDRHRIHSLCKKEYSSHVTRQQQRSASVQQIAFREKNLVEGDGAPITYRHIFATTAVSSAQ